MILDITFKNAPPIQIQGVSMYTIYTTSDPEVVIQFYEYVSGPRYMSLRDIKSIQATND